MPKRSSVIEDILSPKEEDFCRLFASDREFFGNGVQSYIESFKPDQKKQNWYLSARVAASELLTKPNILARINELLELADLNDPFVDKQLSLVITQNADFPSKVKAISEYNKLKARITAKTDVTSGGKPIPILGNVSTDNGDQETT